MPHVGRRSSAATVDGDDRDFAARLRSIRMSDMASAADARAHSIRMFPSRMTLFTCRFRGDPARRFLRD